MKIKNKIIHWLGGYTNIDILLDKPPTKEIFVTKELFRPLTYAAKVTVRRSTIDVFGLENVMSTVKKELAQQITEKLFETTNLVKYKQEEDNNENVIITARLTLYAEENK